MIDNTLRYQRGLALGQLYKDIPGICACGCGNKLHGRRKKWASNQCAYQAYVNFSIIKGDTVIIRQELFKRDNGVCNSCGKVCKKWHADHILEVHKGGGGCNLENFQTLCIDCHKAKTKFAANTYLFQHSNLLQF